MRSSSITLLLSSVVAALVAMTPVTASAREGARSIGNGVKCRPATFVIQPDGTYVVEQFCYKGI